MAVADRVVDSVANAILKAIASLVPSPSTKSTAIDEFDFVEKPPDDYFCPVTLTVLLEPYQTQCCGNLISEEAFQQLQCSNKPCPLCKEERIQAVKDKYHRRKVMSLKVRCPHKAEGCEWEGELGSLEYHLSTNSCEGECGYVNVDCPYACGERVQRRDLEKHKSQHCPLRPFTCQYCNHEATHQEVTKEHWPVCEKYPLPCPNECGEEEMERQHLKGHLEQTCPLEVNQCEFNYAGCGAQLQRHLMPTHVKENVEAHLSMVSQISIDVPQLKTLIQKQGDLIKQQGDLIKQQEDKIKQQENQIKQQGEKINAIVKLKELEKHFIIPPVHLVMNSFTSKKLYGDYWTSPPFYSHLGGYKMHLHVSAKGPNAHVSMFVYLMEGEFDGHLTWPFSGDVTVVLMHTSVPATHFKRTLQFRNVAKHRGFGYNQYISHPLVEGGGYLVNNSLVFCVTDIVLT